MEIHVLNSAVMPQPGNYSLTEISADTFYRLIRTCDDSLVSHLGYPQNQQLIEQKTGVRLPLSREKTELKDGDTLICMTLKYRPNANTKGQRVGEEDFDYFICEYSL